MIDCTHQSDPWACDCPTRCEVEDCYETEETADLDKATGLCGRHLCEDLERRVIDSWPDLSTDAEETLLGDACSMIMEWSANGLNQQQMDDIRALAMEAVRCAQARESLAAKIKATSAYLEVEANSKQRAAEFSPGGTSTTGAGSITGAGRGSGRLE